MRLDPLSAAQQTALNEQHNPAGWPRPRLENLGGGIFPMPWVMRVVSVQGVVYGEFLEGDPSRDAAAENGACQVCGEQAGDVLYAPALSEHLHEGSAWINGTPLCSERCSRLVLRTCPYYSGDLESAVISFVAADTSYDGMSTSIRTWSLLPSEATKTEATI